MGGLALGSWLVGRRIDRYRYPLLVYAALEAGIGLYALFVPGLLHALRPAYVLLRQLDLPFAALAFARALLAAVVLVPPTTLMGGTLPVLAGCLARARTDVGRVAGVLYFVNTAGAIGGCLLAGFYLIEHVGLVGATRLAAATNLGVAVAALALARRLPTPADAAPVSSSPAPAPDADVSPGAARLALLAIGISGFTSLAYEVLWTRALPRYLFNSTYAFSTMLAT